MRLKKRTQSASGPNTDIVNAFNKYFAPIFTKDEDSSVEERDLSQDVVCIIDNVNLLEEKILAVIHNLDSNKAQGPDGIPVHFLKELNSYADRTITLNSFQQIFRYWSAT